MKLRCGFIYVVSKFGEEPAIEQMIEALNDFVAMGLEYVELEGVNERHLNEVYKNRERLKTECDNLGLKVVNFVPMIHDVGSLDPEIKENVYEQFCLGVELATYFGCETMEIDSFAPDIKGWGSEEIVVDDKFQWNKQWDSFVELVTRCTQKAAEANLKLGLHPRIGEIISNTDALLRLMDAVNMENFGGVLDTAHLYVAKEILPLSLEKLGKRIWHLHLADNDGTKLLHRAPGQGKINWDGFFATLAKIGFDAHIVIDVGGDIPDLFNSCKEAKNYIEVMADKYKI